MNNQTQRNLPAHGASDLSEIGEQDAPRRGVYELDVPLDQFLKRGFGSPVGVLTQELLVAQLVYSLDNTFWG